MAEMEKATSRSATVNNHATFFAFYSVNADVWVLIINTIHTIANDVVIFSLNFIINFLMVIRVREDLTKMVVLNLVLYFLCQMSELLFELQLLFFYKKPEGSDIDYKLDYQHICLFKRLCNLLKDRTRFLYVLSYCMNIVLC